MTREYFTNEFLKHIQTTDSIMSTRGYKELCQEVLDTRAEIDRLQAERRWIPVSERLPEYGKAVLIMTTTSVLPRIGRHSPTIPQWATTDLLYYHDISYSQVTHWMPLPEPPDES